MTEIQEGKFKLSGILYGVSVGTGDPELMTLKAVRIINNSNVIAVPRTSGENTLALDIVKQVCSMENKDIIFLDFLMTSNKDELNKRHIELAEKLYPYLKAGKDIAFISIGDISIYSTFSYISEIVANKGFDIEICAGVSSFSAVSARLKRPLVLGNTPLIIMPSSSKDFEKLIKTDCTRVVMKSSRNISKIKKETENLKLKINAVSSCGLPDEKIYSNISFDDLNNSGYFTTIIIESENNA